MNSATIIYLGNVFGNIGCLCGIAITILILASVICGIHSMVGIDESAQRLKFWKSAWKATLLPLFVFSLVGIFTPDRKTFYLMAVANVGESITKTPEAKQLSDKILKVLNQKIDELGAK